MTTKHTPGPWALGDENNESCEVSIGDTVASLSRYSRCPGKHAQMVIEREEMLANAALIAAAPDLLAALEEIATLDLPDCDNPFEAAKRIARDALAVVKK